MGVSMKEVALRAGISTTTVSHVINKTRPVNPKTEARVKEAISELGYVVNPVARNLRSGTSKMIGIVISDLSNFFFTDVALNIDKVLAARGYNLVYFNSYEDEERERKNIESLILQNVDGLIIAPVGRDCSYMANLIGDRCPCVFFDRAPEGIEGDRILSTNRQGGREAVELLISRGFKRIGFLGSRFDATMEERIEGYRDALKKDGREIEEELIKTGSGHSQNLNDLKRNDCYELTASLVEDLRIDALFCGNDLAAVGALSYLKEMRIEIPGELGLVCFDDAFWLTLATPPVSAVDQDSTAIGEKAARVLLDRLGGSKNPGSEFRIPTLLIPRQSC
ncbi:MAG: LacI family DNA-binding transcriptional regulator [Spirochaetales bacterium]|nr:LacI family DNA-binding transcriptional regulator [Spirochaetales bacterium]